MKLTKYRQYLERTAREIKGETDYDKWGDRLIIAVVLLLPLWIIVRAMF
jgi:hypothetical protein